MAKCTLSGHITKPCDVSGAGGVRNLYAIDAKYVVNYTKSQCAFTSLTLQTAPTTQLFWKVDLVGEDTFFNDPSTDGDAGAFYMQVTGTVRVAKTARNRCILQNLLGAKLVFLIEYNDGSYELAGLTGKGALAGGMRLAQISEGTYASGDKSARKSDLLIFRSEGRIEEGLTPFIAPIPDHNIADTYAVGDVVYDATNDCYFQAKNAGTLSALPTCGNSNADWLGLTDYEAYRIVNQAYLAPLINP